MRNVFRVNSQSSGTELALLVEVQERFYKVEKHQQLVPA